LSDEGLQMRDTEDPVIVNSRAFPEALRYTGSGLENASVLEVPDDQRIEDLDAQQAMLAIFAELRRAEGKADATVLTAPHEGRWAAAAARFQSLVAAGEIEDMKYAPLPTGGLEAQFDTGDWLGWAQVAWEKIKNLRQFGPRPRPGATPDPLPDSLEMAIVGDWGTALYGALEIEKTLRKRQYPFGLLMHLGDIYYSGSHKEVKTRFLNHWPATMGKINRALNSNHEMYSGGYAYFQDILPAFKQSSSYFALQNKHWTFVGLDVAYKNHAVDDEQVAWLTDIIRQAGDRRVVLFSHHQLYSQFESQGMSLLAHENFRILLRSKRIFAWYWGHEHRCVLFDEPDKQFGLWGRCIGHGGMPESRARTRDLARATGKIYERADWRHVAEKTFGNLTIPPASVLEGPNPFIPGEEDKFTPHGYAVLTLDGRKLTEQVLDPQGNMVYEKTLTS
jgi:hypothetical protein